MPKGTKKATGGRGRQMVAPGVQSDFTVNDFANAASVKSGRLKKGEANSWSAEAKSLRSKSAMADKESLAWYEKDLSDFDGTDEEAEKEEEDGSELACARPKTPKKKLKTLSDDHGIIYPQDIWFLIGQHIQPGDVQRFGALCKGSHLVVHSVQFWSSLYRRHYDPEGGHPLDLRPAPMAKIHGLQPNVVRSLFYNYPPFQDRVRQLTPFESDHYSLEGARCIMMWHQRVKTQWHFFFKFYRERKSECPLLKASCSHADPLLGPLDIHHNAEQDRCVLKVVTNCFIYLPAVMGQRLVKVYLSVGHRMRYHKLKLVFDSELISYGRSTAHNGVTLMMDPVLNMHVLDWWHPMYPYSSGVPQPQETVQ